MFVPDRRDLSGGAPRGLPGDVWLSRLRLALASAERDRIIQEDAEVMQQWFELMVSVNFFRLWSCLWHLMGPCHLATLLSGRRCDVALTFVSKLLASFKLAMGHDSGDIRRSASRSCLAQRFQKQCYLVCEQGILDPPDSVVASCETFVATFHCSQKVWPQPCHPSVRPVQQFLPVQDGVD